MICCYSCKQPIPEQARFCPKCGQSIAAPVAPVAVVAPIVNVVVTQTTQQLPQQQTAGNCVVAFLLSLFIPGLGQLYKGHLLRGMAWFVLVVIGYVVFVVLGMILHLCCAIGAGTSK